MITVAVTNEREKSRPILEFIQRMADQNQIHAKWIHPTHKIAYINHQKMTFKEYVSWIEAEKNVDMLLVELSRKALQQCLHEQMEFHITVLGDDHGRNSQHMMKRIASHHYIVPETYYLGQRSCLTYGWGRTADISASSARTDIEGQLEVQCCIQNTIHNLQGGEYSPKEFGLRCGGQNVESTLAGVATLLLYGLHVGQ